MGFEKQLDFHDLAVERVQLERREPEVAKRLQLALQRAGAFPSEFGTHEVRKLKLERQTVLDRLAELSGCFCSCRSATFATTGGRSASAGDCEPAERSRGAG